MYIMYVIVGRQGSPYFAGGAIFGSVSCEILTPAIRVLFEAQYCSKIKEGVNDFAGG